MGAEAAALDCEVDCRRRVSMLEEGSVLASLRDTCWSGFQDSRCMRVLESGSGRKV